MRIIRYTCCGVPDGFDIRCRVEFKLTHGKANRNWQLQGGK